MAAEMFKAALGFDWLQTLLNDFMKPNRLTHKLKGNELLELCKQKREELESKRLKSNINKTKTVVCDKTNEKLLATDTTGNVYYNKPNHFILDQLGLHHLKSPSFEII